MRLAAARVRVPALERVLAPERQSGAVASPLMPFAPDDQNVSATMHTRRFLCSALMACLAWPAWAGWAGEPVRVVPDGVLSNPRQPQAAVDRDGTVAIVYGAGDGTYCSVSIDGGRTYAPPVQVAEVPGMHLGARRGPRIAAAAGTLVVTAVGRDGNVLAWRSADRGTTWSGPVRVNDVPGVCLEALHATAAGPRGELYCLWLDLRERDRDRRIGNQIYGAASTDGGLTWSEDRLVYRSPAGGVCPCCHPAVTYDSRGDVYAMWRNELDGPRDMFLSVSRDGGRTFPEAVKLGGGSWEIDFCPMDGGYLAASGPGRITTVWRRDKQVFRTDPGTEREQRLGAGEQPWVAATPRGAWAAWITRRGGELWLAGPDARHPMRLAGHATDPVVAAPVGGEGPVVVAWESGSRTAGTVIAVTVHEPKSAE